MAGTERGVKGLQWSEVVDVSQAAKNCSSDILGDWHRDPWGWPELAWVAKEHHQFAHDRLASDGVKAPALLDVPKENFVLRPAVVLDPLDRLCYQAIVDRESMRLLKSLEPWCFGWRLARVDPEAGKYAAQSKEWAEYRGRLVKLASDYPAARQTDIVSYFASIDITVLIEKLRIVLGRSAITERLVGMLVAWDSTAHRHGLPQRVLPSSVLANLYLEPLDDVLRKFASDDARSGELGPSALRWVDDIWLFGSDIGRLRRAQVELQQAAELLGLNLSAGKTTIVESDQLVRQARQTEHSAVDEALNRDEPDDEPLDELIDRIIAQPETTNRTTIKFATTRMRDKKRFERARDLMGVAHRMPQAADALSRLVRDAGTWQEQADWFIWYSKSDWPPCHWAVAQFGTMFPSSEKSMTAGVVETLRRALSPTSAIALFALAAHRMASWDLGAARTALRDIAPSASAGWQRRILALAGLQAGLDATWVRALLRDLDENRLTLELLQDRAFRPAKTASDYA